MVVVDRCFLVPLRVLISFILTMHRYGAEYVQRASIRLRSLKGLWISIVIIRFLFVARFHPGTISWAKALSSKKIMTENIHLSYAKSILRKKSAQVLLNECSTSVRWPCKMARTSKAAMWESVQKAWNNISKKTLEKYIFSMPRRCQAVIQAEGYHTKYCNFTAK